MTPAYEIRSGGGRSRQTFLCEVRALPPRRRPRGGPGGWSGVRWALGGGARGGPGEGRWPDAWPFCSQSARVSCARRKMRVVGL